MQDNVSTGGSQTSEEVTWRGCEICVPGHNPTSTGRDPEQPYPTGLTLSRVLN